MNLRSVCPCLLLAAALAQPCARAETWAEEPEHGNFYLVMDKGRNELTVRSLTEAGKVFKTLRAISGRNPGDKEVEGDHRTPEGIYFIERRIPKEQLSPEHGAMAFELNYPNAVDRIFKRTGGGIWIHGVDSETRLEKRFDTRGCVALGNNDIQELGRRLHTRGTPLVIVNSEDKDAEGHSVIGIQPSSGPLGDRIRDWARVWSSRDADAYMKFYSPDFYARKMNFKQWDRYKRRLTRQYSKIEVTIRDLKILRHGKYAVAIFDQTYVSNRFQARGLKRLYLVGEGAEAQILAEEIAEERQGDLGSFSIDEQPLPGDLSMAPSPAGGAR